MNTLLLLLIIVCGALQNIALKSYSARARNGSFSFSSAQAAIAMLFFIASAKGKLEFSSEFLLYSVLFAIAYGTATLFAYFALTEGKLSLTSLVVSYSLILPSLYGLIFLDEPISVFLVAGIALLLISLMLINLEKKSDGKRITLKWTVYALLAFLGNGACSIIQRIQQINCGGRYKNEFMIIALLIVSAVLAVCAFVSEGKATFKNLKIGIPWYMIGGVSNGILNLLVLVLSLRMSASVMFPIISAGGIISSYLLSLLVYKEKLSKSQTVGVLLGVASVILLNL